MSDYLKEVTDLATRFAQVGQLKQPPEVNDRILAGLGEDWEPLILSLAPTIGTMTTDALSALLLNQDARRAYRRSRTGPPLSGLMPSINVAYGSRPMSHHGRGRGASRRGRGRNMSPNLQVTGGRRQGHGSGNFAGHGSGHFTPSGSGYSAHGLLSTSDGLLPRPNQIFGVLQPNHLPLPTPSASYGQKDRHWAPSPTSSSGPVPAVSCQLCAQPGHVAAFCSALPQNFKIPQAHILYDRDPSSRNLEWYVDSGPTNHVTADMSNLNFHENPTHPDQR